MSKSISVAVNFDDDSLLRAQVAALVRRYLAEYELVLRNTGEFIFTVPVGGEDRLLVAFSHSRVTVQCAMTADRFHQFSYAFSTETLEEVEMIPGKGLTTAEEPSDSTARICREHVLGAVRVLREASQPLI
jgi:hypothetical protein